MLKWKVLLTIDFEYNLRVVFVETDGTYFILLHLWQLLDVSLFFWVVQLDIACFGIDSEDLLDGSLAMDINVRLGAVANSEAVIIIDGFDGEGVLVWDFGLTYEKYLIIGATELSVLEWRIIMVVQNPITHCFFSHLQKV